MKFEHRTKKYNNFFKASIEILEFRKTENMGSGLDSTGKLHTLSRLSQDSRNLSILHTFWHYPVKVACCENEFAVTQQNQMNVWPFFKGTYLKGTLSWELKVKTILSYQIIFFFFWGGGGVGAWKRAGKVSDSE